MKNFTSLLKTIGYTTGFIVLSFVWAKVTNAQCTASSAYSTSPQSANNTGATQTWNQDAQHYEQLTGCVNGGQYTVSSATSSDYITIRTGSGSGTLITSGTTPVTFTATATTIYIINNTNSSCGTHTQSRVISMNYTNPPAITSISASGCIGNTFSITGTYLSGVTSVSVHGTNAPTFTVNSATSITVTIPTGATTGTVSVTAPTGTATSASSLTINTAPGNNAGSAKTICNGANTTLGASSTAGHTYSWSPSATLSSSTTSNPTATPTTTTTYTLTETITATGCTAANPVIVTVNPAPSNNSGANQSTCGGSASLGASGTAGHTYSWSPSATLSSSTTSNPTATPTTTTTYTLTETITATGCSATNTTVVSVNPLPSDNSGANQTTCSAAGIAIGAASTTGHTYSWSPSATLSSSTSANPTATPTTTTTYTLTETITATGCSAANTTVVTVNPLPGNNAGSAKSICIGANTTIGAANTTGHTYSWSPSASLSSSTTSNPTATPTVTTTYTLTETITATGCSAANSVIVTVNPLPGDNSGPNEAICNGVGVTIGASSTSGHTYSWSPSTGLSSSTVANPTATPTTATTYTLTETITATGCSTSNTTVVTDNPLPTNITPTGTASICSGNSSNISIANSQSGVNYQVRNNSGNANVGSAVAGTGGTISLPTGALTSTTTFNVLATNATTSCSVQMTGTITITVNTAPGNDAGSNQSYCTGGSVGIGASSTSGHTYSWSPSTGLSNAAVSNPTANPTATTTYTLTETITATGCSAVNSVVVTVNSLPTASISPDYCNGGGNVQLSATANSSYLWSNGGTNQSITVNTAGIYTVTVTNAAGCTAANIDTVAIELVTNGNFSQGNVGFTSAYTYTSAANGLLPEGLYAVGSNANYYHPNFFGTAESGSGNFMIINGAETPVTVWSETVTLVPNTYYYFSAWAMSMNNVNPWAILQFAINGTQIGTIDSLATGVESTSGPFGWTRFYATWNSGTSTTATLSITDLQTAANGNDFGLSNISCSTLSTVPLSTTPSTNTPVCAGSTLTIKSNILGGMYPMTYSWTGPNSFTSTSINDSITNVTAAADGVYKLTVTDEHGCTASASTSTVTVNALPGNNAGSAKAICSGSTTTIGASSITGHSYSWSPSTGLSSSTVSNPTASPATTTTYTLTETITATGCTASNTVVVTVNPVPGNDAGSTASFCNGGSATIGVASTTGHTYSWSPSTTLSSSTVSNPTATPTTTTTYTLTETITATSCSAANTVVVTVNSLPANNAGAAKSICTGSSTTIGATSTTGHTYSWSPATALSSSTVANPTANPTATTTYTLTETITATGCSAANSAVVTINPLPGNDAGSAASVCSGASTTIGASSTAGHTYNWSPSTALSSSTVSNPTANPTATTTYTLTETITATGCSAANSVVVTYGQAPTISSTASATICSGNNASLTASCSANCGSSMTYNWSPTTGLSASTGATVTASPTATTTYTITGVNSSGCSSTSATINTGTTITGSSSTANNYLVGDQYTTSVAMTATQIVTYGTAGGSAEVALYSNASGNIPGTQLCATVTGTLTSNGWTTFNIASTYLAAGTYWIVFDINTTNGIVTTSSTGTRKFIAQTYGSLPATAPSSGWTTGAGPLDATYFVGTTIVTSVVTVNPAPGNNAGSNATICNGASTTLGAASTAGHTYSWSPSTALSSSTVSNPSANPTTTNTYTLTETITASGCSAANTVVVTVNSAVGNNAGSPASICSGGSTTIGAASTTGHTYSWSPSTALSSSIISNPSANPTTTTTYTLTETITATGCSAANSVIVTVNASPANDAGSAKTICSGTSTTIGASSTAGHTYSWSPSTALSGSTASNPTANPTTTTTYTLTETITATGCSASNAVTVTVNPLPGNDAGSAASICTGTSAAIGASSTTGHTYSWSPSTALSSSTVSNPSANPTTTTTYTLTETITATGCSVANAVTVTVNPLPGNNAGTGTTICNGSNTTLGAASTTGHTYSWSPSISLSSSTVSNPTASPTTATTYTLTETITATGCSAANTIAIAVNVESANPASASASSATICSGSSTTLTLNGGGGGSGETIRWYTVSCGGTLAGTGNNLSVSPTTTTTYYGRYEDAAPCSYNSTCASITITVNTESSTPGSATASATNICNGQSTTLTLNGGGGGTGEVIKWYAGACGGTLAGTGNNLSVSPTTTTTYYGRYEDALPCNYNSACMAVTITVNAAPGNDAGTSQTICTGTSATIGANSTAGHTYSWSPSTGLSTSTASKPTANPTTTTTYTLTETITATGCSVANNVSVTVNPVPGNDAGSNQAICSGGSATIGASSTTGNTYSWSPSATLSSSTVSNPTANPTTATTYTLTETINATGCSASNSVSVTVNAGPGNNAGSNKSVCNGSGTTIGASGTAGHTYSWSPSTALSSSTVSNPTATPSSTSTYTLTETITATGCSVANAVTVTVNPIPGNDAGSNQTVCSGTAVTIGAASTTGHTYSWSPSTALSSSTVSNPSASPTVNTTYTLTETITATGCSAANTVAVGVSSSPGNNAGSAKSVCNGTSTTIGVSSTAGHTYSWSPSATLSNSTVSNPTANPTTTTTYTLTETITASGCTASNAVVVTVNPLPGNDAGASSTSICSGSSTTLGANSTAGHTYSWSPSTGLSSSTNSKPTANPTTTTTYTLTETITATGCSAANTAVVSVSTTLSITQQPVNETICSGSGSSVNFTTTSSASTATYQWSQLKTGLLQSWTSLSDGTNSVGASISGSATSTLTVSNAPSSMSGWTYYCVETDACNSVTSNTVSLTVAGSAGTWIGSISTDWNNAGNWCGSVPTSTTDVTIPSGTTYSPIISGTGMAYCHNININSGATLTIQTNGYLKMYGNPTISGTYNHTGGKLELDGTSAQTIPAMTVDTVIMNNSNGASLTGNLTVNGILTLTSGIITTGSNEVSVNNAATTSVNGYSSASYIVGNLLRNVNSSGSYDYPLGSSSKYEFFNITLSGTAGFTNIVGTFTNANPLESLLGGLLNLGTILVGGTEISDLLNYGYWTLTPNSTLTAGSYTVEAHEQGQSNSGPTPDSYALLKRHSASDSWAALGTHKNSTQSVTNGVVKAVCSNLTSFSDYSIGYGGGVLPIKLESFTAQLYNDNKDALLDWITASEENNDYFEVEVATENTTIDGQLNFQGIGRVEGNGTSFVEHSYSFIDTTSNKSGTRYYRLKQVNFDSTFTYSDIDPLTFANNSNTVRLSALYPNPCMSMLHFELSSADDEGINIYVNGMSGQEVFKERLQMGIGNNNFSFDVSELAHALYLFNVANDNNSVSIHDKFEKQ